MKVIQDCKCSEDMLDIEKVVNKLIELQQCEQNKKVVTEKYVQYMRMRSVEEQKNIKQLWDCLSQLLNKGIVEIKHEETKTNKVMIKLNYL